MRKQALNMAMHLLLGALAALAALYFAAKANAPSEAERLLDARADEPSPQPLRRELFARLDRNRDGEITRRESRPQPELESRFDELDRDANGRISKREFRVFLNSPHFRESR